MRSKGPGLLLLLSVKGPPRLSSGVIKPGVDTSLICITEVKGEDMEGEVGAYAEADTDAGTDAAKDESLGKEMEGLRSGLLSSSKSPSLLASELPPPSLFVSASTASFFFEDFLHKRAATAIKTRASRAPTLEPAAVAEVAAADALLDIAAEAASTPPTPPTTITVPPAIPPTKAAPKEAEVLNVGNAEGVKDASDDCVPTCVSLGV